MWESPSKIKSFRVLLGCFYCVMSPANVQCALRPRLQPFLQRYFAFHFPCSGLLVRLITRALMFGFVFLPRKVSGEFPSPDEGMARSFIMKRRQRGLLLSFTAMVFVSLANKVFQKVTIHDLCAVTLCRVNSHRSHSSCSEVRVRAAVLGRAPETPDLAMHVRFSFLC